MRLAEEHLESWHPLRVLPLTLTHRRIRLEWYRARGNWTAAERNQVVFSDESRSISAVMTIVFLCGDPRLPRAISQQDNSRSHTVKVSQDCLRNVITLPWPARSPILSSIEHSWDYLGRQVGHPTSLNELEARLQQIWNEMSQDITQNLYASMPDHIALRIRARGSSTGY
ncbi:transposable element Tcb2 transposase [Trichonephila clavipes]|nr:transposable element Tcb2 transposase [Trichonephila clavipes]